MILLALAAVLLQDPAVLAGSLTEEDPAAAFRVISDLVDLAESRRAEVEKAADKLPPFYRAALHSELKTRRELGDRFGRGTRIDLKGSGRKFWDYVDDLGRHPGMAFSTYAYQREKLAQKPLDADFKDVWPLQALVLLCDRSNQYVSGVWEGKITLGDRGHPAFPYQPPPWFFYRNIAVPQPGPRWRKLIDFSGPPRWRGIFRIAPLLGPDTQVVMWKDLKLIEARRDDGTELKVAGPEDSAIPGQEWTSPSGVPEDMDLALDVGEREGKISRLRCSIAGRVPREWRRFTIDKLDGPDGGVFEDDDFEFSIRDSSPEEAAFLGYNPEIRIRPKRIPHADLEKVPVTLILKWDTKINAPYSYGFSFSGKGEATVNRMRWMGSLKPATHPGGEKVRRLLSVEVVIPIGLQDRPIFMEFRDIPLK